MPPVVFSIPYVEALRGVLLSISDTPSVDRVVAGERTLTETEIARLAASLRVRGNAPVTPRVLMTRMGRPVLEAVTTPRLDARVQEGSETPACLEAVGHALAVLHATTPANLPLVKVESPPWEALSAPFWMGLSRVQRRMVGMLHTHRELRQEGRRVRDQLAAGQTWCHGDARTNNICVLPSGTPVFIDWEASGTGRPEADLGLLCSSLITDSLVAAKAPRGPQAHMALSRGMNRAAVLTREALSGYRGAGGHVLDAELLARAVGCGLLARVFMRVSVTQWDRIAETLYQIGSRLLLEPSRWRAIDACG
ncbi:aminoglycoside phosphotransferase family protein [Microbispora hainanensis]|uniref:Aminoglycoside phosphotransferase family protein n=2 Tax=Microbispora hainanensis TaxID=568844 RepID=A0ABZ1T5J9_9ACTN